MHPCLKKTKLLKCDIHIPMYVLPTIVELVDENK